MPEEKKAAETEQERLADFPRDLSRSFTYLHRQRKKYMDDRLRGYGFVGGMPMILLYINRHPGTTQDAIVSHMYIDKCTVARRTKRLEELGYISRETGKEDRRENNLYVTESGRKARARHPRDFAGLGQKRHARPFRRRAHFTHHTVRPPHPYGRGIKFRLIWTTPQF